MGSLYIPFNLRKLDILVAFHGTLGSTGTIADAANYQRNLWVNNIGIKDKIIFAPAIPQDHISQSRQYGLTGVGIEEPTFLMGDNLNYARAAVEWAKNGLIQYLISNGLDKARGDVYLFGHSQGGKLVTKINTLTSGIKSIIANAPGPIQWDLTCANAPGEYSCSKIAAIHGASTGDGSEPYQSIGLETYTNGHNTSILFTQALDDTTGGGSQSTWLANYIADIRASGNPTMFVETVPTGGHAAYETNATLKNRMISFISASTTQSLGDIRVIY